MGALHHFMRAAAFAVALSTAAFAADEPGEQPTLVGAGPLPIGSITAFGGRIDVAMETELLKAGWIPCDGRPLAIKRTDGKPTPYVTLYGVIRTNFGAGYNEAGAKVGVFNVPDFRGRFLRGVSGSSGRDPDARTRGAMQRGGLRGNEVGSVEAQSLLHHTHQATGSVPNGTQVFISRPVGKSELQNGMEPGPSFSDGGASGITRTNLSAAVTVAEYGGNETRPKNANINWIIKYK